MKKNLQEMHFLKIFDAKKPHLTSEMVFSVSRFISGVDEQIFFLLFCYCKNFSRPQALGINFVLD